jgi:hypothetical protein
MIRCEARGKKEKMNWKWVAAAIVGLAIGLSIASFERRTVFASTAPADAHFQMQAATVDEPDGAGGVAPVHEVFLLDTESGRVWKFQGLVWTHDKDGSSKMFSEPKFFTVAVESGK